MAVLLLIPCYYADVKLFHGGFVILDNPYFMILEIPL